MKSKKEAFLLYDPDCGPCSRFASWAKRYGTEGRIVPIPLTDSSAQSMVDGVIPKSMMFRSFHLVQIGDMGEKIVSSAGDGLIRLIEYLPFVQYIGRIMSRDKQSQSIAAWTYLQVTRIRNITCTTS